MNKPAHNDIAELLQRFMDGQTTLQEEALLAEYFRTANVPEQWRDYQQMFAWFDEGMPETDEGTTAADEGTTAANESLSPANGAEPGTLSEAPKRRKPWIVWLSAAAAIALLLVVLQPWRQTGSPSFTAPAATSLTAQANTATANTQAADTLQTAPQQPSKSERKTKRQRYSLPKPPTYYAESQPPTGHESIAEPSTTARPMLPQPETNGQQESQQVLAAMDQHTDRVERAITTLLEVQQLETALAMEGLLDEPEANDEELW